MSRKATSKRVEDSETAGQDENYTSRQSLFVLDEGQIEYLSPLLGMPIKSGRIVHSHPVSAFERYTVTDDALRGAYTHAFLRSRDRCIVDIGASPGRWVPSKKMAARIKDYVSAVKIHGLCPVLHTGDVFRLHPAAHDEVKGEVRYCECTFQQFVSDKCDHAGQMGQYGIMSRAPTGAHTFLSIHSLYYLPLEEVFSFLEQQSAGGSQSTALFAVLHKFVGVSGTLCNGDLQWWRDTHDPSMVTVQVGRNSCVDRHHHNDLSILFETLGVGIPYKGGCICTHVDAHFGDTYCLQLKFAKIQPAKTLLPIIYNAGSVATMLGTRVLYNVPLDDFVVRADQRHAMIAIKDKTLPIPSDWFARAIDFCRYKPRTAILFTELTRLVTRILATSHIDQGSRNLISLYLPVIAFTSEVNLEIEQLENVQLAYLTRLRNRVIAYFDYLCGENYTLAYHAALISWKQQPNYVPMAVGLTTVFVTLLYAAKRVYGLRPVAHLDIGNAMARFVAVARAQIPILGDLAARVKGSTIVTRSIDLFTKTTEVVQDIVGNRVDRFLSGLTRQARVLAVATLEELVKRCMRPQLSLVFGIFEAFGGNVFDVMYHAIMHYLLRLMPLPAAIALHTFHNLVHRQLALGPRQWVLIAISFVFAWFMMRRRARMNANESVAQEITNRYLSDRTGTQIGQDFVNAQLTLPDYSFDPTTTGPNADPVTEPLPFPGSPTSALSLADAGLVHVEGLQYKEHARVTTPRDRPVLKSEWATPSVLPMVPASDTDTLLSALPRVKTRATTPADHKLVKESKVATFKPTPIASLVDDRPKYSSFCDWNSSTAWAADVTGSGWLEPHRSHKWTVVPSAVIFEPSPRRVAKVAKWSCYGEYASTLTDSTDAIANTAVKFLPCYNILCVAKGRYHTMEECTELAKVNFTSAPSSLAYGWYWYSCDQHFVMACMKMVSQLVDTEPMAVHQPFAPFTYLNGLQHLLPHIPYPRINGDDINYDAWAARYTKSKRNALDAARHSLSTGGEIHYATQCFTKREKLLWAAEPFLEKRHPRVINGTSASFNVRFGPFFWALGEQLRVERGPCHMLLEGDYFPIVRALLDQVDLKIFTTGDDCLILIKTGRKDGNRTYWAIMLDANRFDGTQNSRVFVLKLLFNLVCGMPPDMINDYQYRPLRCKSFVGVDFMLDYQCLSGEPGTSVNNSAIMETIGVGIASSLLSSPSRRIEPVDIINAIKFWADAFQIKLTSELALVDPDDLVNTLPAVTHCSGWFLASQPTELKFSELVEADFKTYDDFVACFGAVSEEVGSNRYVFSTLIGRFLAKTGFSMDAGEQHDAIMLATIQSMAATTLHVPIVRVLAYKVIERYYAIWRPELVAEYGRLDEFAWRKTSTVISRATPATWLMCAKRYKVSVEALQAYERALYDQPLPLLLGGELVQSLLAIDLGF